MDFNFRSPVVPRSSHFIWHNSAVCIFPGFAGGTGFGLWYFLRLRFFRLRLLIQHIDRSNTNIASFLDSIKFDDLSYSFKTESDDPSVKRLHQELNEAMLKLRSSRREKDSEFLFFKNIVMHVGIGLLVFKEDGKVEIFNSAARKLLKVNKRR